MFGIVTEIFPFLGTSSRPRLGVCLVHEIRMNHVQRFEFINDKKLNANFREQQTDASGRRFVERGLREDERVDRRFGVDLDLRFLGLSWERLRDVLKYNSVKRWEGNFSLVCFDSFSNRFV